MKLSFFSVARTKCFYQVSPILTSFSSFSNGKHGTGCEQVTALLRRVLPEVPPSLLASLVGVETLPSTNYGILQCLDASSSSLDRLGIIDVFLACIAKALTVQVKTKGRDKETSKQAVTSVVMPSVFDDDSHPLGNRWWMRGSIPRGVAESIIQLVKDMAAVCGVLSKILFFFCDTTRNLDPTPEIKPCILVENRGHVRRLSSLKSLTFNLAPCVGLYRVLFSVVCLKFIIHNLDLTIS